MRALTAVTAKVTAMAPQKYRFHWSIRPRVLAMITMKGAETVEKPVAMMAASRTL
ncbi:hypothetical protein D3C84_1118200 [compost metagenome]